jgi:putative component of toxin-antitoxin plasmid stabilization module
VTLFFISPAISPKSDEFDAWLAGLKNHVGKALLALLLLGGDQSTQKRDIKRALQMASVFPKD